jgi:hypothetical protein
LPIKGIWHTFPSSSEQVLGQVMSPPTSPVALRIRCRQIGIADIDALVNLVTRGFHVRTREFWVRAFARLTKHSTPQGFPKYGYLLECNGTPVGVILLIFSVIVVNQEMRIRCSVSSWYVEPRFRSYATILLSQALRNKQATYFNITPDPKTLPILEAQGYVRYCTGRFLTAPAISAQSQRSRVEVVTPQLCAGVGLQSFEMELLGEHAKYGCISLTCGSADDKHPFVFLPLRKAGMGRFAYLAYCRDLQDFVRFAGPLGRFLAWRGYTLVVIDANGPIRGLVGRYLGGAPKYFRGPDKPRLGDLAYSERVMFGF